MGMKCALAALPGAMETNLIDAMNDSLISEISVEGHQRKVVLEASLS